MRSLLRVAFLLAAMLAMNGAFAQVVILFGVDGLKMGDRANNTAQVNSFTMGFVDNTATVQSTGASGAVSRGVVPGARTIQDAVLTMPMGDAAIILSRAVMDGHTFPRATVQYMPANGKSPIFQVVFYDALVTSVVIGKGNSDGGTGFAEVKLRATGRVEMSNSNMGPTGQMTGGAKAGFDLRSGKTY